MYIIRVHVQSFSPTVGYTVTVNNGKQQLAAAICHRSLRDRSRWKLDPLRIAETSFRARQDIIAFPYVRPSVCLSVYPSVCPWHGWIS